MTSFIIHTDGGSRGNPGPAAIGFTIHFKQQLLSQGSYYVGKTTNNVAEYQAVLYALKNVVTLQPQPDSLEFYLDSQLVARQLEGLYKIKQPHLQGIAGEINQFLHNHQLSANFHYIPREENVEADTLVNQALDANLTKHNQ